MKPNHFCTVPLHFCYYSVIVEILLLWKAIFVIWLVFENRAFHNNRISTITPMITKCNFRLAYPLNRKLYMLLLWFSTILHFGAHNNMDSSKNKNVKVTLCYHLFLILCLQNSNKEAMARSRQKNEDLKTGNLVLTALGRAKKDLHLFSCDVERLLETR